MHGGNWDALRTIFAPGKIYAKSLEQEFPSTKQQHLKNNKPYLKRIKRKGYRIIRTPSKLWQSPCHRARNTRRFKHRRKHCQNVRYNEEKHHVRQALVVVAKTDDFSNRNKLGLHVEMIVNVKSCSTYNTFFQANKNYKLNIFL